MQDQWLRQQTQGSGPELGRPSTPLSRANSRSATQAVGTTLITLRSAGLRFKRVGGRMPAGAVRDYVSARAVRRHAGPASRGDGA